MPQYGLPTPLPRFFATIGYDFSQSVPTSVVTLIPRPNSAARNYVLVVNVSPPSGGANVWISWTPTPGVQTPGSIILGPYGNAAGYPTTMEFGLNGGIIPQLALYAISDGGGSGSAAVQFHAADYDRWTTHGQETHVLQQRQGKG